MGEQQNISTEQPEAVSSKGELLTAEFLAKLEQLELVSRKIFLGRMKGERLSKRRGQSVEFADYKSYVPGDDIRFLDWNIYGRLDRLFVKLFLEEEDLHVYLLIDTSASMGFGQPAKLWYAKQAAAALAFIALTNHDRVLLTGFSNELSQPFGPARGRAEFWRLAEYLTELRASGLSRLTEATRQLALRYTGKGIVILFSDFLHKEGYESGLRYLLAREYDVYAIHIMSRDELEPQLQGDLRLIDSEDGDVADVTISAPLIKRYKQQVQAFRSELRQWCTKKGVTYAFVTSDSPFEELVFNYLRKRGLIKA